MSERALKDAAHRDRALAIDASFIVQAPAGSGKTELLTLRFLKLLSVCEQPEQVLAITFTRKAANEMSKRIVDTLRWADSLDATAAPTKDALEEKRLTIARLALSQDKNKNWHLLQNPARLRIQTIDSFCNYLANQLPVLSQLGGNPRISEDVQVCFTDAITNTLKLLESETQLSDDIATLLAHVDNDVNRAELLLNGLLYKRDQWLPHVLGINSSAADAQRYLQQGLDELVIESLQEVSALLLPRESDLVELVNFAATNLQASGKLIVTDFEPLTELPQASFESMPYWQLIADSLLTQDSKWRRTVNVKNGFPAADKTDKEFTALCKHHKQRMLELLQDYAVDDDLLAALAYLRLLPDPNVDSGQWQFLAALTRVLARLASELLLSFRKYRLIDYVQTSSAARAALGDESEPTDLALALDHRIQHILVDEFQDTSQLQLDILQQITAGWEPGDGRSIFLVGDAMQSCYGFRNANVGIYLNVSRNGLRSVPLEPLTLETNFRSQQSVVDWVNTVFTQAFPGQANISRGAVPYTRSVAWHPPEADLGVTAEFISYEQSQTKLARALEAELIVKRIQTFQQHDPDQSIAVLVRARPHLNFIIPALRAAGIHWQSTDIDRMATLPVIEDLISLTRAVLNKADRVAWLALLRAPWCGLTIGDLHVVSNQAGPNSIWSALNSSACIDALSTDAKARIAAILPALDYAMSARLRLDLRGLLENCWRLLGGSHCTNGPAEMDSVAQFFVLVSNHSTGNSINDIDRFCEKVAAAFVPSRVGSAQKEHANIHLLTMHKAKGLEFDHVILPSLANKPRSDDKPLLQWHERLNAAARNRLYIATLSAAGSDEDKLYTLLRHEQQHKTQLENTRLLYIAITRARKSVHLSASLAINTKQELLVPQSTLLHRIWRELEADPSLFKVVPVEASSALDNASQNSSQSGPYPSPTPIRRLQGAVQISDEDSAQLQLQTDYLTQTNEQVEAANEPEASIGTLIHRSLESICRSGDFNLDARRLQKLRAYWRLQLNKLFDADAEIATQQKRIETALLNTIQNKEIQWVFDKNLQDSEFELPLSRRLGPFLQQHQIDRCFIDQHNVRWIIDYKSSQPAAGAKESVFIDEQCQLHGEQLQRYRELFEEMESRPVKTALLLTSLGKLVELN